ncbi:peptide transporter [archaeon]|nr:peptide transporter [archaeon]|tara:strand:+ start:474 stop:809 length:336 start_codon:yes stop_codon:yes gene_type:complete
MDIGIGTSLVNVNRFKSKKALKKVFTQKEISYCVSKIRPREHFAARFAGKSAVIKAFSGFNKKLSFSDIEIIHLKNNQPKVLVKSCSEFIINLSLSHEKEHALAFTTVIKR